MATVLELCEAGKLTKLDPCLDHRTMETRLWYVSPRLEAWLSNDLPKLGSSWNIEISPQEQLAVLVEEYAKGEFLSFQRSFHPIRHVGGGVWMMKTADLRIFGWFWKRDHFIGHCADLAERVKLIPLYHGYAGDVVRFREAIELDEPKFIAGVDPNDVISNFSYP